MSLMWGCAEAPRWFAVDAVSVRDRAGCPPPAIARAAPRDVSVAVSVDADVAAGAAAPWSQAAAGWWAAAGVRLVAAGTRAVDLDEVFEAGGQEGLRRWWTTAPEGGDIDLVWVRRIASPRSEVARVSNDIAGFTIDAEAASALGLPARRAPVVFAAADVLARLGGDRARWVVAHEIGHALGLSHDAEAGNLMAEGLYGCPPSLRADQAGALAR